MAFLKKIVAVLGMHRSGTSILTAGLAHCGVPVGNELMGAARSNIKGHWEDNDTVALNNRVLSALNLSWDSLGAIDQVQWSTVTIKELVSEAKCLLLSKFKDEQQVFAFKDPRTLRVLPFWFQVFDELDVEVHYVFGFRNPADVCASLSRRDAKLYAHSQLIWLHHNLDYLESLLNSGRNVCFSDFYDFCKSPRTQLLKLMEAVGFEPQHEGLDDFESEFYDEKLVSKMTDPYQMSTNKEILTICFDTYRLLRLLSHGQRPTESLNVAGRWLASSNMLAEQWGILQKRVQQKFVARGGEIAEHESTISSLKLKLSNVKRMVESHNSFEAALQPTKSLMQNMQSEIKSNLVNFDTYNDANKANYKNLHKKFSELHHQQKTQSLLTACNVELNRVKRKLDVIDNKKELLQNQLNLRDVELNYLKQGFNANGTENQRLKKQLDVNHAQRGLLKEQLIDSNDELKSTKQKYEIREVKHEALQNQLNSSCAELQSTRGKLDLAEVKLEALRGKLYNRDIEIRDCQQDLVAETEAFEEQLTAKENAFEEQLTAKENAFEEQLTVKENAFEVQLTAKENAFEVQLDSSTVQLNTMRQKLSARSDEKDSLAEKLDTALGDSCLLLKELEIERVKKVAIKRQNQKIKNRVNRLETSIDAFKKQEIAYKQSLSWRITAPLRGVLGLFKRKAAP